MKIVLLFDEAQGLTKEKKVLCFDLFDGGCGNPVDPRLLLYLQKRLHRSPTFSLRIVPHRECHEIKRKRTRITM